MMGYDIREVLPEVFRIPVPLEGNPLKELNSYLFRGSREAKQRNLLVDTGLSLIHICSDQESMRAGRSPELKYRG